MRSLYYYLIFLAGILTACQDGYERRSLASPGEDTTENWVDVTFNMQLPSQANNISTYGMTENDETHIKHVDVIAFLQDGGKEYYAYQTEASIIQDAGNNKKKFTVKLKRSDALHRFVVLANCQAEVEALGAIPTTTEKDDVLALLTYTHTNAWQNGETIPMWGESSTIAITNSTSAISGIQMIRMLARIDVTSTINESEFKIEEVHFYHYNTSGYIVPASSNFDAATHTALFPTIPANPGRAQTAQAYTNANNNYLREIYAFETDSALPSTQQPCLVIGGSYNGGGTTYYKIAFINEDEEELPILRNHLYTVRITDIAGEGYNDADAACHSKAINISSSVLVWNQGTLTNIVYDDEYMLGVSQNSYELPKEAKDYTVIVTTDYPDCWVAKVTEGSPWLSLEAETTCTGSYKKDALGFSVGLNETGQDRTGIITITAGHLVQVIEVVQGIKTSLRIIITDMIDTPIDQLYYETFIDAPLETQQFKVTWDPVTSIYDIGHTYPNSYHFSFGTGDNPLSIPPVTGGSKSFTIIPPAILETELDLTENGDPFITKAIHLSFSVTDGGETSTDQIDLIQEVFGVFPYPDEFYDLDGEPHTFKVRSNVSWTAELHSGSVVESLQTTSGGPNKNGEDMTIIMSENPTLNNPGVIEFTFTTPLGKTGKAYAYIYGQNMKQGDAANCYMIIPGGKGVIVPVIQANKDGVERIKDGDVITAELLWTDSHWGLHEKGAVSSVAVVGTGPEAKLYVMPGESEGNAVVAARVNGTIRWSWHIWVVNYNPDEGGKTYLNNGNEWMDRNIGALSATPGDPKTLGLVHQWGRKDPYPGLVSFSSNAQTTIYKANREVTSITPVLIETQTNCNNPVVNLELTIENPMNFYEGRDSNYKNWWASCTGTENQELWMTNLHIKTAYDPCPDGWIIPQANTEAWDFNVIGWGDPFDESVYGANWGDILGYWPAGSYLDNSTMTFNSSYVGSRGFYWSGDKAGNTSYYFLFHKNNKSIYGQEQRSHGMSVRCMKERGGN